MIKKLLILLFVFHSSYLFAQTIKTDVLVIGGSPSGVAAAVQSARSKVKTVLAENDTVFFIPGEVKPESKSITFTPFGVARIKGDINLSSGIWGEFRNRFREYHKDEKDLDTAHYSPLQYDTWSGFEVMGKIMDTVKNLTVYKRTTFSTIKKDNDYWEVRVVQDGKAKVIRARVVIDATPKAIAASMAGGTYSTLDSVLNKTGSKLYRTSIAMGDGLPDERNDDSFHAKDYFSNLPIYYIPLKAVITNGIDNLLITEAIFPSQINLHYLPWQLTLGQGVGATAAYCAFFKTTTKHLKVRVIQGELLDFKAYLLPFDDIMQTDPDWRAIQQVSTTGLLKGTWLKKQFDFMPDAPVTTAEIKPVLTEIYTRAFLWFNKEKPGEKFTIENTLSLISDYTLTNPLVLKNSVQKDWKIRYKFKQDFDLKRQITRREFAVLANRYLNPFARTVDLDGKLVN